MRLNYGEARLALLLDFIKGFNKVVGEKKLKIENFGTNAKVCLQVWVKKDKHGPLL